jgi:hypothetical protein
MTWWRGYLAFLDVHAICRGIPNGHHESGTIGAANKGPHQAEAKPS